MTFKRSPFTILLATCIATAGLFGCTTAPEPRTQIVESPPMRVDRIYHSMQGPYETIQFDYSDLDWITALTSELVDVDSDEVLGELLGLSQAEIATLRAEGVIGDESAAEDGDAEAAA